MAKEVFQQKFLPSLTGQNAFNDATRALLALPVRLGGLEITDPSANTTAHHDACTTHCSHHGKIPPIH